MIDACTIKSNANGLTLILDDQIDFETLIREVCAKFANSKNFFGKMDLILRVEGRDLTGQEITVLIEAIELNSLIHIILVDECNELKDARMADRVDRFYFDEFYQNAKIITGSVKKNDEVYSDGSVLILGDIKKGGKVRAKGNIIVTGEILGEANAGCEGEKASYIVANDIHSDAISIADLKGDISSNRMGLFRRRKPAEPVAVVIWEGVLIKEPLEKGVLKQLVK